MAYAAPPLMGYLPPPAGPPVQPGLPSHYHSQGQDALTNALSGLTISPATNPAPSPHPGTTQYPPASYQPVPLPGHYAQHHQAHTQSFQPVPISHQTPVSASQPPPIPSASTRPVYPAQSPAPTQKSQFHYSPGYQHILGLYRSSQPSVISPASTPQNPIGPPGQYGIQPQLSTPQPPVGRRPVGTQPQTLSHGAIGPPPQGPSYAYQPQPQYAQHPAQHPQPYNPQQPPAQAMAYAGPPQLSSEPQSYIQPQQPEKKGRGLLSSTGKLGVGLVGGLTTAVAGHQGKEKLEKWGKGKMNMFAGAMGYAPSAPSHAVGRPSGGPGPRPVSYAGPPGPRPVQYILAGSGRASGGGHPVATGMLVGAVAGGVGGVVGASLARDSNAYQHNPSAPIGADGSVVYDQTTVGGGSYVDASSVGEGFTSSGGDASTATFSTQYGGYGGAGDATVYTDTTVYADGSGTTYTDTSTVYADPSGAVYTDTTTTTYADSSSYGQPDVYSGSAYTGTSYAADSSYAGYGDATYTSSSDVYTDTSGAADTGGIAEVVGSGSGGGSWMDNLGLGSLTDASSWGGGSLDSGAAALALI